MQMELCNCNLEHLKLQRSTPEGLGEMLLLSAIINDHYEIRFQKRGRYIYWCPEGEAPHRAFTPFPARLGGRLFNHYRALCNIRFPTRQGWITVEINQRNADFQFSIESGNAQYFSSLILLDNHIASADCEGIYRSYFAERKRQTATPLRVWRTVRDWWAGDNLDRLYGRG